MNLTKTIVKNIEIYSSEVSTKGKSGYRKGSSSLLKLLKEEMKSRKTSDISLLYQINSSKIAEIDIEGMMVLAGDLRVILPRLIKNIDSLANEYSKYNLIVGQAFGFESANHMKVKNILRLLPEQELDRKVRFQEKVRLSNLNQTPIEIKKIFEIIKLTKASSDVLDNIICFMLASQSRLIEVLSFADFKEEHVIDGVSYINQTGVAKDKVEKKNGDKKVVIKPMIDISFEEAFGLLKNIRADVRKNELTGKLNREITNHYNSRLNKKIKTYNGLEGASSHLLRKISANLSYKLYGEKTNQSLQSWLTLVLGHASLGSSALNYSTIKLI
jgi:hypothetical protein